MPMLAVILIVLQYTIRHEVPSDTMICASVFTEPKYQRNVNILDH
jgi:hypothetical protein